MTQWREECDVLVEAGRGRGGTGRWAGPPPYMTLHEPGEDWKWMQGGRGAWLQAPRPWAYAKRDRAAAVQPLCPSLPCPVYPLCTPIHHARCPPTCKCPNALHGNDRGGQSGAHAPHACGRRCRRSPQWRHTALLPPPPVACAHTPHAASCATYMRTPNLWPVANPPSVPPPSVPPPPTHLWPVAPQGCSASAKNHGCPGPQPQPLPDPAPEPPFLLLPPPPLPAPVPLANRLPPGLAVLLDGAGVWSVVRKPQTPRRMRWYAAPCGN